MWSLVVPVPGVESRIGPTEYGYACGRLVGVNLMCVITYGYSLILVITNMIMNDVEIRSKSQMPPVQATGEESMAALMAAMGGESTC